MRTRPYFKKLLRVGITSFIFVLLFLVCYWALNELAGIHHPALAVFITLMLAIYFYDPVAWAVRGLIDRAFYRNIFHINQSLNRFNLDLNSTLDQQLLLEKFVSFLENTFSKDIWAFYFCWGKDFELWAQNETEDALPKLISLPKPEKLNKYFKDEIDFFSLHKIRQKHSALAKSFKNFPSDHEKYYFFFPLKSYKGYVGFLLFQRKFNYYLHFWELKKLLVRILKKTADVLENAQLYSEVRRKSLQNNLLLDIGKKISASLDLNEVLETIMDSISPLVSYDAAGIFLIDKENRILRQMVTRGYDKSLLDKLSLKLNRGIYGWVIRNKKPSIINDVLRDPNYYSVRETTSSQLTLPLLNGDDVRGVMALESDRINHFTPADLELLMTFASQAVIAIENAQLFEESMQKRRLESELVVASKVQKALLPERPPNFPGLKISACNIPSRIVGGDFYDVFKIGDSKLGVAIGDVSGKGAPASILMAMLYAGFKSLLKEIFPVVEVVARLNNLLTETTAEGYFATFFFGIIDKEKHNFTFTNAGHNAPILLRKDGTVERLETGGIVLGFLNNQDYRQEVVHLATGDQLFFFTDGITEVKNSRDEEFGDDRLIEFLRKNSDKKPKETQALLLDEIKKFSARKDYADDVTLIIVKVE